MVLPVLSLLPEKLFSGMLIVIALGLVRVDGGNDVSGAAALSSTEEGGSRAPDDAAAAEAASADAIPATNGLLEKGMTGPACGMRKEEDTACAGGTDEDADEDADEDVDNMMRCTCCTCCICRASSASRAAATAGGSDRLVMGARPPASPP